MKIINKNSGNWIAIGVALGAAIDWTSRDKNSS